LDWGAFQLLSFDWLPELQYMDSAQLADFWLRVLVVSGVSVVLVGLVTLKLLFRLTREFSDPSLALLLERRFPRELGDRLITAVELVDPRMLDKYGYSPAMVERTVHDAADRVESLPVKDVFNWRRLKLLGLGSFLATIGLYLAVGVGWCGIRAALDQPASPLSYWHGFNQTAGIWAERSLFFMNTYWPRNAYLEFLYFQDTPDHPGEMRVARDENRPDLRVRAIQWVLADTSVQGGWRPLLWSDLADVLDKTLLQVNIPIDFPDWVIDLEDLDPAVSPDLVPRHWNGKSSGQIRLELGAAHKSALGALEQLLDWHTWTVDRILVQEQKGDVRRALRALPGGAHKALKDVIARL